MTTRLPATLAVIGMVALAGVLPPLAAGAGVGPADRRAILVFPSASSQAETWNAVAGLDGRPIADRFDGRLVLAAFDGPVPVGALRGRGAVLALNAALLRGCGAF